MEEPLYVVVHALQENEIAAYCLGECGKGIFACITDEYLGALQPCWQAQCPYLEGQGYEPIGEVDGHPVILRKLIAANGRPR